jgi:hypothetical protein
MGHLPKMQGLVAIGLPANYRYNHRLLEIPHSEGTGLKFDLFQDREKKDEI